MDCEFKYNDISGEVEEVRLFGKKIAQGAGNEFTLNKIPFKLRKTGVRNDGTIIMRGERFVDESTGYAFELARHIGERPNAVHCCTGVEYWLERVQAVHTYPEHGPGDNVIESPVYADTISLFSINWTFWGEDTRMIFSSAHSGGPIHEYGHCGYENDTPNNCKRYMQNIKRRIYPGTMVIHGGVFYNIKTEEWIAITCRKAGMGYILNIKDAGMGVSYDFTIHREILGGELFRMPEIKLYYGKTRAEMQRFMSDYVSHYYKEPPEWVYKSIWCNGLAWDNEPSWTMQAEKYEKEIKQGLYNAINCSLVTNRPIHSGTLPYGYMPDPNHGTIEEFKYMCSILKKSNIPFIIWMSHSGLCPGGADIDDDWFIRGIDGRMAISWGEDPRGMYLVNPGHPGYIEYTQKWIRFYIKECGAKGIFLDCLGWQLPCDFKKRSFMRNPGDTNIMAIKFAEEVYSCVKECDPDAILTGEGTSTDMPINLFSIVTNDAQSVDNIGPRDFILSLINERVRFALDSDLFYSPAVGMTKVKPNAEYKAYNVYMKEFLEKHSGDVRILKGDVSICGDIIFVPMKNKDTVYEFEYGECTEIEEIFSGKKYFPNEHVFSKIPFGIYKTVK